MTMTKKACMKTVIITPDIKVGALNPCVIVAELGGLYEDIDGMKHMIRSCKDAGAHLVKIQTYRAETISLPGAEFILEDKTRVSQYDFFKKYEISRDNHKILFDYARQIGIPMISTPSHYEDVELLEELKVPAYKIGSDDLTNIPFLRYIARKGKPVVISTGMSTLEEVKQAVSAVMKEGNEMIVILHCTTAYPPDPVYVNLNIVKTFQASFNFPIGYSDHFPGIFSSLVAATIPVSLIEKHITLNRSLKRPDYQVSIEPDELKQLVDQVRMIPILMGEHEKKPYLVEEKWRINARKSLIAAADLKKGHILKIEDIKIMRPGAGVSPADLDRFIGKQLKRDLRKNEFISYDNI